jgi:hypothetical protein
VHFAVGDIRLLRIAVQSLSSAPTEGCDSGWFTRLELWLVVLLALMLIGSGYVLRRTPFTAAS